MGPVLPLPVPGNTHANFLLFSCQSLLETHDSVASQACDSPPPSPCDCVDHDLEDGHTPSAYPPPDAVRMVGIRKVAGEHLVGGKGPDRGWGPEAVLTDAVFQGVTFKVEGGELVIARILHGGIIDQQGLLHVGDIIKEVGS